MPAARARQLVPAACDRHRRKRLERSQTGSYRQVTRAKIVLLAARGMANATIAARLGITADTARKWRGRFATHGMDGLKDRPRPGRPPRFTPVQVAEVKALACQLPAEQGVPLSLWSCPEPAREAVTRGITRAVSASTVGRWLAEDASKPWQHRSWIFIRDPDFRAKASRVLDLYARSWDGRPLGADEYVLCADEKTSGPAPAAAAIPPCRRARPAACGSTTTTTAAARWPTWPPTTSARHACSAAAPEGCANSGRACELPLRAPNRESTG